MLKINLFDKFAIISLKIKQHYFLKIEQKLFGKIIPSSVQNILTCFNMYTHICTCTKRKLRKYNYVHSNISASRIAMIKKFPTHSHPHLPSI